MVLILLLWTEKEAVALAHVAGYVEIFPVCKTLSSPLLKGNVEERKGIMLKPL